MRRRGRRAALALGMALVAGGCVASEHAEVVAARDAWEACVEEKGPEHDECQLLAERMRTLERRYEQRARGAWGCHPAHEECPTPR